MDADDIVTLTPAVDPDTGQVVCRTAGLALHVGTGIGLSGFPNVPGEREPGRALRVVNGDMVPIGVKSANPDPAITLTYDRFAAAGSWDWARAEAVQDAGSALQIVNGELVPVVAKSTDSGQSVTLTDDRFASVSHMPPGPAVVDPATGTDWAITDVALRVLDRELAAPVPERGAALIGAVGSRLVTAVLVDPRPGESASYWHSDALRERVAHWLDDHPEHRYVGTAHSHPGGHAEPSGPDREAFTNMLLANPGICDALFPIVVGWLPPSLLGEQAFSDHLVELQHGTLAGFSAHLHAGALVLRRASMRVVPVSAHCDHVAAALTEVLGTPIAVRWGVTMEFGGTSWLTATFTMDGRAVAGAAFSSAYPLIPPMIWRSDSSAPVFPGWSADSGAADLTDALRALCLPDGPRRTSGAAVRIREGIGQRLVVHLPRRIEHRVVVVGAGSVGSNAAEMLVRSGVRRLTVVDFDTVEAANLSRTVYTGEDLGTPKTTALRRRLTSIAPDLDLTMIPAPLQQLTGEQLDRADLVFLASDDMAGEGWLNQELYSRSVPFVSVKLFAGADGAELAFVDPARNTACLRCMTGASGRSALGVVDYGTGRVEGSPALGPDIVSAAARGVRVALALTQSEGPLREWLEHLADARLTYFLSSNVAGWKYTEFARPGSQPFDGVWLSAPGSPDCEICGAERVPAHEPALVGEFTIDPPSGAADPTSAWGLFRLQAASWEA